MSAENEIIVEEASGEEIPESPSEVSQTRASEPATPPQPAAAKNSRPGKDSVRRNRPDANQVVAWFAACARCSFFLAAYRLDRGVDALTAAAEKSRAGWLVLDWDQSMCKLVRKSYGSQLDLDCYHYDGSCPECRRQFVYHTNDGENSTPGRFRIELKPRTGR